MTLLFIAVATGVLVGTVFLWLSGYYTGQAMNTAVPDPMVSQQLLAEQKRVTELKTELNLLKNAPHPEPQPKDNSDADTEIAKLSSRVAQVEGERDKALFDIDNLKEELEQAKDALNVGKTIGKPTSLPKPQKRDSHPVTESEAFDELQAKIDMEKVAHQLTKDEFAAVKKELAQLKKIAAVKLAGGNADDGAASKGSRFKTMAIGMRSPVAGGADQDILRAALEKVQTEKDRVDSELERAKKEIQFLKMRS